MGKCTERLYNGIVKENPTFVQMLGMCPTLAVTTSAINGAGMGLATTVILTLSNFLISLLRRVIPDKVRIPAFIVIIASFVTLVQFLMQAYIPSLYDSLGIFIPLIVVNCIILGRAESYASKSPVLPSIFDGIGMGLGFTVGLTCIGVVREFLGNGTVFGFQIIPESVATISIFVLAPGAFFVLAFLVALINKINISKAEKAGTTPELCKLADCASCGNTLCGGRPAVETNVVAGVEKAAVSENKEESAKDAESKKAALKTDDSIVVKNEVTSTSEKNAKINKEEKRGEE